MYGCDWVKLCGDEMRRTDKRDRERWSDKESHAWRRRGTEGEERTYEQEQTR